MNDIQIIEPIVSVEPGQVSFNFELLEQQAREVAEFVSSIEVTEDNIKESKKLIAKVNKVAKELTDRRIAIKKQLLEPYSDFEQAVNSIVDIIKQADTIVRTQVKELEEQERDTKREVLQGVWNIRSQHYNLMNLVTFEDFLEPRHLNKTEKVSKTEQEMVEFLERTKNDLNAIQSLDSSVEILEVYSDIKDVSRAIQIVSERTRQREQIQSIQKQNSKPVDEFTFKVKGHKDKKLVEMLLKENGIEYEVL